MPDYSRVGAGRLETLVHRALGRRGRGGARHLARRTRPPASYGPEGVPARLDPPVRAPPRGRTTSPCRPASLAAPTCRSAGSGRAPAPPSKNPRAADPLRRSASFTGCFRNQRAVRCGAHGGREEDREGRKENQIATVPFAVSFGGVGQRPKVRHQGRRLVQRKSGDGRPGGACALSDQRISGRNWARRLMTLPLTMKTPSPV